MAQAGTATKQGRVSLSGDTALAEMGHGLPGCRACLHRCPVRLPKSPRNQALAHPAPPCTPACPPCPQWERSKWVGVSMVGKTLAIMGFGKVGSEVARRAKGERLVCNQF